MSQVNDTNYVNQIPLAADYVLFVRDSDGVLKTATMQQLADLFSNLSRLTLGVTFIDSATTLTNQQLVVGNSSGAFDMTLPAAALNSGRSYRIFNKGAGVVTVLPNGSDTIANAASITVAQYATVDLTSDGIDMWAANVSA